MYENHRKSFYRDDPRDYDDDRFGEDRWRSENRGAHYPYRGGRFAERGDWDARNRAGYAGTFRDDDYGRYGPDTGPEYWRGGHAGYGSERGHWAHDAQHHQSSQGAASYGYGAGQPYGGGEGDSRYFTGQQGSWVVGSPYGARGGRGYGADYREHGYTGRHDPEDRGFWDRASDEVASWFGDEDAARRRDLDHRGRGPKDYIRSDDRIREDANDRLTDDPIIDASNVTLTVQTGEITLNGTVGNRAEKRRAEDLVERISGVKHVQNNLRVAESTTAQGQAGSGNWTVNPAASVSEGGTIAETRSSTTRQTTKA